MSSVPGDTAVAISIAWLEKGISDRTPNRVRSRRPIGTMPPVLRRTGYILGLLFVAACAAAWFRSSYRFEYVTHHAQRLSPEPDGRDGYRCTTLYSFDGGIEMSSESSGWPGERWSGASLIGISVSPDWRARDRLGFGLSGYSDNWRWRVRVPYWLPVAAVSLFMAWRWRCSRLRQSTGFPLDQRTIIPANHST
jgi:hypothetical protein